MSRQRRAAVFFVLIVVLALFASYPRASGQSPRFSTPGVPIEPDQTTNSPAGTSSAGENSPGQDGDRPDQVGERLRALERQNDDLSRRLEAQDQQLRELSQQKTQPAGQ